MTVLFGIPMGRGVYEPSMAALMRVAHRAGMLGYGELSTPYARVDIARNKMIEGFKAYCQNPNDLLVMLDDDHIHPWDVLERMAAEDTELGIVAGLACKRGDNYQPMLFTQESDGKYVTPVEIPERGILEVDYAGTAVMSIRRWVFDQLDARIPGLKGRYFQCVYDDDAKDPYVTEDFWFAHLCQKAGIKHYVDLGIESPHMTMEAVGRKDWECWQAENEEILVEHFQRPIEVNYDYVIPGRRKDEAKVFYGVLLERMITDRAANAILGVCLNAGWNGYRLLQTPMARTATARNQYTKAFLQRTDNRNSRLIMLDADHEHPKNVVQALAEAPKGLGVIGALAFNRHLDPQPCFYFRDKDGDYNLYLDLPENELMEGEFVGTGAIAIERWVFEELSKKLEDCPPFWWVIYGKENAIERGEDWTFANLCEQAGIRHYCHTGIETPHLKWRAIDRRDWQTWCKANLDKLEEAEQ